MISDRKKARRIALVMAFVLLVAGLVTILTVDYLDRSRLNQIRIAFETETKELTLEKQRLLIEYSNLERNKLSELHGDGYFDLVFTSIDSQLYDEFFLNVLNNRENPISCTMCLTPDQLPGKEGLITRQQFELMLKNGWRYVIYWNGEGSLEFYLDDMREALDEAGIAFPNAVMFSARSYSTKYDKLLERNGIKHAIHHGEENLDIVERSTEGSVWHPGITGWNTLGVSKKLLNEIATNGGCAMLEISFSGDYEVFIDNKDTTRLDSFIRMLGVITDCIDNGQIEMTSLDQAKKGRADYLVAKEDVLEYVKQRREEILLEVADIEEQILIIYNKYDWK